MRLLFVAYFVLAIIGIVCNSINYSKGKDKAGLVGVVICLIAGFILFLGFVIKDPSSVSGYYVTKINGVTVSSGAISFFSAFAIGLLGAAFPNFVGMAIGYAVFNGNKSGKKMSLFAKIVCAFLLTEAVSVLIMALSGEDANTLAYILATFIFLIPGIFLLVKWVKTKGK